MILPMEQTKSGGAAMHSECGKHLDRIAHPTAVILIGLDEQGGSFAFVSGFQRRVMPDFLRRGPGITL